jgi:hypothetical protein
MGVIGGKKCNIEFSFYATHRAGVREVIIMPGPFESGSSKESAVNAARSEIATAEERARQQLQRTRDEVAALQRILDPMAQTTSTMAGVAGQLANLVITAAGEITRSGPAGRSFMPFIEQLAAIARTSEAAHHDLQRQTQDCRTRLGTLLLATEQSRAALDPIAPAASSLAEAAARRAQAPAVQVVVHVPGAAADKTDRVAQLSEEVLRQLGQRPSGFKN